MRSVIHVGEPMSAELRCGICGETERQDWKQCARVRGLICPEHCGECEYYEAGASIGVCRWEAEEYEEIADGDHGQGLKLCGCRMWLDREAGRYIIAVGRQAERYILIPEDRPEDAVDRLLREADAFAGVAAHTARRGNAAGMLNIDMLDSRGVALRPIWNDMWELRRLSMDDGSCRREIYLDPLEAWEAFREALRIRMKASVEASRRCCAG